MRTATVVIAIATFSVVGFTVVSVGPTAGLLDSLSGAFIGTIAGALLVTMQLRMEQTRFFQLLLDNINDIYSSNTAWRKTDNGWSCCEFRMAVGMADWTKDPIGKCGDSVDNLIVDQSDPEYDFEWGGVVYTVDDKFCVASKPLHEYANWYSLLLDGLQAQLVSTKHVPMLWRSLVDSFFIAEEKDVANSIGMLNWSELFVFGNLRVTKNPRYRLHKKVLKMLRKYPPAVEHVTNRRRRIREQSKRLEENNQNGAVPDADA